MEKVDHKMLKIHKKVVGNLVLEFKDFQNMSNPQIVTIPASQESVPIPLGYVLSMFYMPNVLAAYKQGL